MVPVKPAASGLPAVGRPAVAAAAVPAPMPTAAAAAAPRPVACRKCRRVTPGRPGRHGDPVASWPCSRELVILVDPLGAGCRSAGEACADIWTYLCVQVAM